MYRILLLIDYSSEFSRKLFNGLVKYSKENGSWIFYRLPSYYMELYGKKGVVQWAQDWKADAILAQWDHEGTNLLQSLGIPVVLQNLKHRSEYFTNLTGDYKGTGKLAAEFFTKKRFRNFAFYGYKGVVWSQERAEGYRTEVERIGGNYYAFESENLRDKQWVQSRIDLECWLNSLPKPIALFACDDNFALQVTEICQLNNINIPDEISLLGVDNDEFICNLSDPTISSIALDVERGGYEAGKVIHQLIEKKNNIHAPIDIIIHPIRIELRQSTEKYSIKNIYIKEIVKYIENNFTKDICIDKFTEIVPLSRRNLEVKFRNEMGVSIYQFILYCRIEHLAMLLATTNRTLLDLAIESGFNDSKNISRVFKKFKGYSPVEYRKKFKFEKKNS